MTDKQIDERKEEVSRTLEAMEHDCYKLLSFIHKAQRMLKYVRTESDAEAFDKDFEDLEDQLIHIRLFY